MKIKFIKRSSYFESNKSKRQLQSVIITTFFILTGTFSIQANQQEDKITINFSNSTIEEALDLIKSESDYRIFYSADELNNNVKLHLSFNDTPIESILSKVLEGQSVGYYIENKKITISKKLHEKTLALYQKIKIKGTVRQTDGTPIPGVTVMIKGTTTGTITDINGSYSLDCNSPEDVLVISFIGMKSQEIKVGDQKTINTTLHASVEDIDEIVITAFGTGQKKESVVGSVQTIKPKDLIVPSANLSTAFAGRLAGVVAFQRTGEPGADGASFYIRGISTLSGTTSPLIVIDGVEVSANDLNALPPEVIEGFSILKDATATAMYGTRGANGVMIITTKNGANLEKPAINIRVENSISQPTSTPEFVNGVSYMRLYNEAVTNQSLGDILYTDEQINGTAKNLNPYVFPNVNWYNEIFKNQTHNQIVNLNIRGGGKKVDYFMNVGITHQTGMLKNRSQEFFSYNNNIDVMRYAFQNNINANLSPLSKLSLRLNTQIQSKRSPNIGVSNIYNSVMNTNPVNFPVMYPDPNNAVSWIKWGAFAGGNEQGATNPLAELTKGYNNSFNSTVIANLEFSQKLSMITEGLSFKAMVSFKNFSSSLTKRSQGYNRYTLDSYEIIDDNYNITTRPLSDEKKPVFSTSGSQGGDRRIYFQTYIDYSKVIEKHSINTMLLYNQDQFANNNVSNLLSSLPRRRQGVAARASYGFDNKYLVEFNLGYNGSENFAEGYRWGLFPSVAVGYNISRELFFQGLTDIVSNLKFRASYGVVGNDQIGGERFIYLSDVDLTGSNSFRTGYGNNIIDKSGPSYNRYQNNNITWETGKKINLGADIQLFRDINIMVDFFQEMRDNIFQEKKTIPNYLGTSETKIYGNFAKVKNSGFDIALNYGKQVNNNLTVQFKGTFTYATNKILEYDEPFYMEYPHLAQVGRKLNTYLAYRSDHLFIDQNHINNSAKQQISGNVSPGDIKYLDMPNRYGISDGIIDANDKVYMGHPQIPEIIYGFGPSVKYKKFDVSCLFQGVANTSLMMSGFHPFGTQYNRNVLSFIAEDYWSPDNQNIYAAYPRLTKIDHPNNTAGSDFWIRDASFIKLKNAEVGFSHKNMRFYVSGLNLLTFSSFKYWDPEQGGGSGLKYPTQRVFNIGFQMTL